jgi:TIR domain
MAHEVFISYSSKDKSVADAICYTLEANGLRCWIAPRDILPGMNWGSSIIDAIATSRVMMLVLVMLQIIFWPLYVAHIIGFFLHYVVPLETFCNTTDQPHYSSYPREFTAFCSKFGCVAKISFRPNILG